MSKYYGNTDSSRGFTRFIVSLMLDKPERKSWDYYLACEVYVPTVSVYSKLFPEAMSGLSPQGGRGEIVPFSCSESFKEDF